VIHDAGWVGGQHLMTRPLSNDLRERVVAAVVGGESCRAAAARFGIAVSSVVKWSQRYRATGSVAPGKMGGHRKRALEPHRAFIKERISQTPHLTLHGAEGRTGWARRDRFAQCGLAVPAA
jgi:transposase